MIHYDIIAQLKWFVNIMQPPYCAENSSGFKAVFAQNREINEKMPKIKEILYFA